MIFNDLFFLLILWGLFWGITLILYSYFLFKKQHRKIMAKYRGNLEDEYYGKISEIVKNTLYPPPFKYFQVGLKWFTIGFFLSILAIPIYKRYAIRKNRDVEEIVDGIVQSTEKLVNRAFDEYGSMAEEVLKPLFINPTHIDKLQSQQINFNCAYCGAKYSANATQAGKEGKCKKCGNLIKVPAKEEHSDLERPHLKVIQLRSKAIENLSMDDVKEMVIRNDFYDLNISRFGNGIQHDYELLNRELVIDHITGLTWQQGGSNKNMTFEQAHKYVQELNNKKYAGYNNWRLPTIEEGMSLIEKEPVGILLHIDPIFDRNSI